jgi:hypothetical protein
MTFAAPSSAQFSFTSSQPMAQWTPRTPAGSAQSGSYLAVTYIYDDGSAEDAIGLNCGVAACPAPGTTDTVWATLYDTNDPTFAGTSSDTITRVDVAIGASVGGAPPVGTPIDVYVFEDQFETGDPHDIQASDLVTQGSGINNMPGTNVPEQIMVPPGVVVGRFWVVAVMAQVMETTPVSGIGEFPAAIDLSTMSMGRCWASCRTPAGSWTPAMPQASCLAGGWAELDAIGLPSLFLLRAEGTGTGPTTFCTAKTTAVCGAAMVSATGVASATAASGFTISATPTRGCRAGLLLYSNQPIATAVPFGGPGDGVLCLTPAGLRRAGPIDAGGTSPATCDGVMSIDMNAFRNLTWAAGGCASPAGQTNPAGFLGNMGVVVNTQIWGRDSVATGQVLSNGLSYTVGP